MCVVKDTEKIQIFSVKDRSLDHLNDQYIWKGPFVNNILLVTIPPSQKFCKGFDIEKLVYMIKQFLFWETWVQSQVESYQRL